MGDLQSLALVAAAAMLATAAAPARSQPAPGLITKLAECRRIADDARRLACLDATAASITSAADNNELVVLDREQIRQTRRGLFGFNLGDLSIFRGSQGERPKIEPINEADSSVAAVQSIGYELWRLTLGDGSEWETLEPFRANTPRQGVKVNIRRNGIGTYFLRLDGGKGVKAQRRR